MKQIIETQLAYNTWANAKIFDSAARLSNDQLDAATGISHDTLRTTLKHMVEVEWVWRMLPQHSRITVGMPPMAEAQSIDELRAAAEQEADEMNAWLATLDDAAMAGPVTFYDRADDPHEETLYKLLLHRLAHSMQHRTEAAAMLSTFEQSPGDLDLIFFLMAEGAE